MTEIHHVFACKSNVGDWLSARAIQALLQHPVLEYLCDEPFVPGTLERLASLGEDDLVVVGGGGLFMDYFTPFWEGLLALERVPRFCVWGVGYCDIKNRESSTRAPEDLLRAVVERAELCIVRDELTRSYLAGTKLPSPVPCPTFGYVGPRAPRPQVLHVLDYAVVGEDGYQAVCTAARALAAATGRTYAETNNLISDASEHELAATLDLYAADLVVSSRLHGCIVGLASGCRVMAVAGDRKVDSLMEAAGLGDWTIPLDRLDDLEERLAHLPLQRFPREFVAAAADGNRRVAEDVRRLAGIS